MQSSLAATSAVLGMAAAWSTQDWRWLAGAVLILANWPYTLLVIMPTNHKLKAISEAEAGAVSRNMLEQWGRLHAVRTALGCLATIAFLWALN